jgi:hypothetical protein
VIYGLPDDYFATYQSKIEAISQSDVDRVAKEYITPETMTILVVGDQAKIAEPLQSLPFVKSIQYVDPEGNPIPAKSAASQSDSKPKAK